MADNRHSRIKKLLSQKNKNADIIVDFEDFDDIKYGGQREKLAMHYIGILKELPKYDAIEHEMAYPNGAKCHIGDVVCVNDCHYVLARTHKLPYIEWVTIDNPLTDVRIIQDLSNRVQVVELSVQTKLSGDFLEAPTTVGALGQILVLSNDNKLVWSDVPASKEAVVWGDKTDPEQAETTNTKMAGFKLMAVNPGTATSSEVPAVVSSEIELSDVAATIAKAEETQQQLLSTQMTIVTFLSTISDNKTVGALRDAVLSVAVQLSSIMV